MCAMRLYAPRSRLKVLTFSTTLFLLFSVVASPGVTALTFQSSPARFWGKVLATDFRAQATVSSNKMSNLEGEKKSEWRVTFSGFPNEAKEAVLFAVDVWSRYFESKVPINVEATWGADANPNVLGSARPGYYFSAFLGAPDDDLWYPSALANTLAEKDLNPNQKEIFLRVNSTPLWHFGVDGNPPPKTFDLSSVVIHEIAHGLGFLSNAQYDQLFGSGYIFQPTPYDAYVQLPDGRVLTDFCSRSTELGKALISPLFWSGSNGVAANGGDKPKLYTPSPFEEGSSITHLDEDTFSKSQVNIMMTPTIGPGEVFRSPGPVVVGMIKDMLSKPPARNAVGLPSEPMNVKALVGDRYALLTFDSSSCSRIDQVTKFIVKTFPGGDERTFRSQPIRIDGLKNGKKYRFELFVQNNKGKSQGVISNYVKPQDSKPVTRIDSLSNVTSLAAIQYKGKPLIVYGDELSQSLKMATLNGARWQIATIRKGLSVGHISLCSIGTGSNVSLHIFYGETREQDLIHTTRKNGQWNHEVVDGDGLFVQDYRESVRTKTASDVSVSNACVITQKGLQVYYRDETQGILLGAVKTKKGWAYEIIDGDKNTQGRTTGDVAFTIDATSLDQTIYLIYDSVLSIDSTRRPISGEVRISYRNSIYPEDWKYITLDGPESGTSIAGYATLISNNGGSILASWLSSGQTSVVGPSKLLLRQLDSAVGSSLVESSEFGSPSSPLFLGHSKIYFGCHTRLCAVDVKSKRIELVSGKSKFSRDGAIQRVGSSTFLFAIQNRKLVFIKEP